jgi:inosine-uridine nucleoside N-ribohydrolase
MRGHFTGAPLSRIRLHIDTDGGTDDALALLVAARLPGVEIVAVSTVFGNVPVETATRNMLLMRTLQRQTWPVVVGAAAAADGLTGGATYMHGQDGLGGCVSNMPEAMVDALPRAGALPTLSSSDWLPQGGPIVLLGLGPATNIPLIVERYGVARIARIVLMSGAIFDVGNVTADAEFNAWCDPVRLAEVLGLGVPTTLVPLDLTRKIQLSREVVNAWVELAPPEDLSVRLVVAAHQHYMGMYLQSEAIDGCVPHDLIAVLVACWPERFLTASGHVGVGTVGPAKGVTELYVDARSQNRFATGGSFKWIREGLRTLEFR